MQINAVDHVNIVARDLDATIGFYEGLLGLRSGHFPPAASGRQGAWLYDSSDNPIVHVSYPGGVGPGNGNPAGVDTGAISHVAFHCRDYDSALRRLGEMDVAFQEFGTPGSWPRQIFLRDPNDIAIELSFRAG